MASMSEICDPLANQKFPMEIYPDLSELNMHANQTLIKNQADYMVKEINNMKEKLKHYKQLMKRWKKLRLLLDGLLIQLQLF